MTAGWREPSPSLRTPGIPVQIDVNVIESTRKPRIGFAQPTCQADPSLGLSGRLLAFSDDGLQPLRSLLGTLIEAADVWRCQAAEQDTIPKQA